MNAPTNRPSCLPTIHPGYPDHYLTHPEVVLIRDTGGQWIIEALDGDGRQANFKGPLPRKTGKDVVLAGRRNVGAKIRFDVVKVTMTVGEYRELMTKI